MRHAPHLSGQHARGVALRVAVFLLVLAPTVLGSAGAGVGAFRMFTAPAPHRLVVLAQRGPVWRAVGADALGAHLGRDARRVILPALRGALLETHGVLLAEGLGDLARVGCRAEPRAERVVVMLEARGNSDRVEVSCR